MDLEDPMMDVVQTHIIPSEETIDADVVQVELRVNSSVVRAAPFLSKGLPPNPKV